MTRDELLKLAEKAGRDWPDDFTTEQGADLIQAGVRFNRIGPKIIPELLRRLDFAERVVASYELAQTRGVELPFARAAARELLATIGQPFGESNWEPEHGPGSPDDRHSPRPVDAVAGWRWCPVKDDLAEWEEDQEQGCHWCMDEVLHEQLYRVA